MNDWQPIETAPKDGTTVLAWFRASGEGWAELTYWRWRDGPWVDRQNLFIGNPTHWMPLPEPPEAGE